jgi:hypothetical protein
MKLVKRFVLVTGIAAILTVLPTQVANAYWGWSPGAAAWRHAYVHDPGYRYAHPAVKRYIRDLYLHGPEFAAWRERRRHGWW